jgi:hypothetical protein
MNEDAMSDGASRRPASRTLGDLVDEMATGTPGAEALVFRDERLDCAGLKAPAGIGRPPTAFCAGELRSPAQFTDAGFVAFNRHYVERLAAWGVFRDEVNPVARSNACPEIDPPATPSFYAFSYTLPSENRATRSFVAAGSGEAREGGPSYEGRIIRRGDQSPEATREKARFVLGTMEQRMAALGFGWADVTATQVYTIFDIRPLLADEFVRRGAIPGGLTWHFARPPVQGLDFEVDVRGVDHELVI